MSVTSATFSLAGAAGLADPIEATVSAEIATSASEATTIHLRIATYPPWWCFDESSRLCDAGFNTKLDTSRNDRRIVAARPGSC